MPPKFRWQRLISILLISCSLTVAYALNSGTNSASPSQDNKKKKQERYGALKRIADLLFYDYRYQNYEKALEYYKKLDAMKKGKKWKIRYQIAKCYIFGNLDRKKALPYLLDERVQRKAGKKRRYRVEYWTLLGRAYHYNLKLDEAKSAYEKALSYKPPQKTTEQIQVYLQQVEVARELLKDTLPIRVENLGPAINTPHHEYVPVITPDERVLMFTSRRPGNLGGLMNVEGEPDTIGGMWFEDIYVSIRVGDKWLPANPIGQPVNSTAHDATVSLSVTGDTLYMYRSDARRWGDLYMTYVNPETGTWTEPEKLPPPINSKYFEGHITFSIDGQIAIFSSNRPGGLGGKDLWMVKRLPDGSWGEPINLGPPVNTPYDEDGPFLHPDGKTLYFSSNGPRSMGDYDIFVTRYENGKWTEPVNLGYPINTPDQEIFFVLSADGKRAYVSSIRPDGFGKRDIYIFHLPYRKEIAPEITFIVRARVVDAVDSSLIPTASIFLYDQNDSLLGVYTMVPDKGYATLLALAEEPYRIRIEAEGYQPYESTFLLPAEATSPIDTFFALARLQPATEEDLYARLEEQLPVIYFDFDRYRVRTSERAKIDSVVAFLRRHPDIKLWVIGACDAKGTLAYNLRLGKKRAQGVTRLLIKKGIARQRLRPISAGEVLPAHLNFTLEGEDNPTGRALNRRTFFRIYRSDTQFANLSPLARVQPVPASQILQRAPAQFHTVRFLETQKRLPADFFHGLAPVFYEKQGNTTIYYSGIFTSEAEAQKHAQRLQQMGLPHAKVITYPQKPERAEPGTARAQPQI